MNKDIEEINPKIINNNPNSKDPREISSSVFFKEIQSAINNKDDSINNSSAANLNNFKGKYEI